MILPKYRGIAVVSLDTCVHKRTFSVIETELIWTVAFYNATANNLHLWYCHPAMCKIILEDIVI